MDRIISRTLSTLIYGGLKLTGFSNKNGVRILCYHSVNDRENKYTTISVDDFRAQMKYLADNAYHTISLSRLLSGEPLTGSAHAEKPVIITFDDGFRDIYENAFPILKEFGFSAAVFCIVDLVGQGNYLTKDHILEMRLHGFEFGSHTLSHPELKSLDRNGKWQQIGDSKKIFEEMLGFGVNFFCYPYGIQDAECVEIVQKSGYKGACSNRPGLCSRSLHNGVWRVRDNDRYLLPRTEIASTDTVFDFKKKMAGAYDLLHGFLHRLRGRP